MKGGQMMFNQALWQIGRTLGVVQILQEMDVPADPKSDDLGLYHKEFALPKD